MRCGNLELFGKFHRNIIILIVVVSILAICIILGIYLIRPKQQAAEDMDIYKSYTSIEIKSGDSLWSIASEHMTEEYESVQDYVKEIKDLNGLGSDEIHAGKFLLIPYYVHQ